MEQNAITEPMNLVGEKLTQWYENILSMLPNIFVAIILLLAFIGFGKVIKKYLTPVLIKKFHNVIVVKLTTSTISIIIATIGLFIALETLGLSKAVTSLLAGAGVAGLAIGFAFQDLTANYIAGFSMALQEPIRVGDIIETQNTTGQVKSINFRTTVIDCFDGEIDIIPNRILFENPLKNYTQTPLQRVHISLGVAYDSDLEKVEKVLFQTISQKNFCSDKKDINILFAEFAQSSINVDIYFWVDLQRSEKNLLIAKSEAIKAISKSFKKHDITIPFPTRTVHMDEKN